MRQFRQFYRSIFDVRPGEGWRALFMALPMTSVLLDSPDRVSSHAPDVLGIAPRTAESALRDLLRSGDSWIVTCAIAAAAEMKLKSLAADIARVTERAGKETAEVARQSAAALA